MTAVSTAKEKTVHETLERVNAWEPVGPDALSCFEAMVIDSPPTV
jgi:hypothetical protein